MMMYCIECGNALPDIRDNTTICSKCGTPLATWWDELSQTFRTNREALDPNGSKSSMFRIDDKRTTMKRENLQTTEERAFQGALICLQGHFEKLPGFGSRTMTEVRKLIDSTLVLSLNRSDVREALAKNVDIWMRLQKIFNLAIPTLVSRSLRDSYSESGAANGLNVPETASLILKNYDALVEDLQYLNNVLVIARNMLAIKETAQEICAAVLFDKAVNKLIILSVNVTSKGYDGENVDELSRGKLNEVTELYKKLLVTCLQHTHNWTMGNDRFKMSFWFEMLFDNEYDNEEVPLDNLHFEIVYEEVKNWLRRHSDRDKVAASLLDKYSADVLLGHTPGPLPPIKDVIEADPRTDEFDASTLRSVVEAKYEQDRLYARVSHEIDIWWKSARDANFEGWVVPMETVEGAIGRAESCKENAMHRSISRVQESGQQSDHQEHYHSRPEDVAADPDDTDDRSVEHDNGENDAEEEDDVDDDDSYVEGPLRGLLTEIPNILDTKQIEALHMTVKACIVDSMGSGLTPAGENLQKTRCKMFLALDCGKNLLREMLVFIAVWEQTDQQFIFQITAQIIESFHHNALLPYAWNSLRIMKDIVSPAQTVLLRLINYMFRARKDSPIYEDLRDFTRDSKLIHFLYNYFRCRVVPDCIGLIFAQAQIRTNKSSPNDFPVDLWDMERAKDGLSQYLDFISVIADIPEMRPLLIEWEAIYELIALLKALEAGVARKSFDERATPGSNRRPAANSAESAAPVAERLHDDPNGARDSSSTSQNEAPSTPALPPLHDTPHKFPWAGIKIQILIVLTSLIAEPNSRRYEPGDATVQKQLLDRGGIMPLLNCCVYDGHNEYLKERATVAIKYAMEGCEEAQKFVRELVPVKQAQARAQAHAQAQAQARAQAQAQARAQAQAQAQAQLQRQVQAQVPAQVQDEAPAQARSGGSTPTTPQSQDAKASPDSTPIVMREATKDLQSHVNKGEPPLDETDNQEAAFAANKSAMAEEVAKGDRNDNAVGLEGALKGQIEGQDIGNAEVADITGNAERLSLAGGADSAK